MRPRAGGGAPGGEPTCSLPSASLRRRRYCLSSDRLGVAVWPAQAAPSPRREPSTVRSAPQSGPSGAAVLTPRAAAALPRGHSAASSRARVPEAGRSGPAGALAPGACDLKARLWPRGSAHRGARRRVPLLTALAGSGGRPLALASPCALPRRQGAGALPSAPARRILRGPRFLPAALGPGTCATT